jgi:zinc transport system substrate-binding protein
MERGRGHIYLGMILAVSLVVAGCKKQQATAEPNSPRAAATIYPLMDIARNIGGDKISVICLMPPGASPHTFEVSNETIERAQGTRILFKIGSGLDDWADGVTNSLGPGLDVKTVSDGIALRKFEDGSADPHYWLSLKNGETIARNVANELSRIYPQYQETFSRNLAAYQKTLAAEDAAIRQKLSSLTDRKFATFHEAWFYFADAYGFKIIAAFEPYPGREPTPDFLNNFIRTLKENKVKVIFSEPQFSPEAVRQVAEDLGVKLATLDPEGGGTEQTRTYTGMMQYNADTIYEYLK